MSTTINHTDLVEALSAEGLHADRLLNTGGGCMVLAFGVSDDESYALGIGPGTWVGDEVEYSTPFSVADWQGAAVDEVEHGATVHDVVRLVAARLRAVREVSAA